MFETWVLTVFSETTSSRAICLFDMPARDEAQHLELALRQPGRRGRSPDTSCISRAATEGASSASPRLASAPPPPARRAERP